MVDDPKQLDLALESPGVADARGGATADVANALQSLSRAARSFSLYDPQNDAVKRLIAEYKQKTQGLIRHTPLTLEIYPFEVNLERQSVYKENDRERSLSFRLFRDGVRRLRFERGVDWSEMVSLLEVLSVRCTGVRQQEDDLITLLRKASFAHIGIEAVEGYVPDEEQPEAGLAAAEVDEIPTHAPPKDWDQPLPAHKAGQVEYRDISPAKIRELQAEEGPERMPSLAVRAVRELFDLARGLGDKKLEAELLPFLEEVQEFLLIERSFDQLAALAALYQPARPEGSPQRPTLPFLSEPRAFERLLRALPDASASIPESFFSLLAAVPGDHIGAALELLAAGAAGGQRKALVAVIEREAKANAEPLLELLPRTTPPLARELFAILGQVVPERSFDAAFGLLDHPDPEFQLELIDTIGKAPPGLRLARGLQKLMSSPNERVRVRAVDKLAERGGPRAVPTIAEHLEQRATQLTKAEASACGRALVQASEDGALEQFGKWVRETTGLRGIVSRLAKETQAQRMLLWTAVAGLEVCDAPLADKLLSSVLAQAQDDLARHCRDAMARRAGGAHRA